MMNSLYLNQIFVTVLSISILSNSVLSGEVTVEPKNELPSVKQDHHVVDDRADRFSAEFSRILNPEVAQAGQWVRLTSFTFVPKVHHKFRMFKGDEIGTDAIGNKYEFNHKYVDIHTPNPGQEAVGVATGPNGEPIEGETKIKVFRILKKTAADADLWPLRAEGNLVLEKGGQAPFIHYNPVWRAISNDQYAKYLDLYTEQKYMYFSDSATLGWDVTLKCEAYDETGAQLENNITIEFQARTEKDPENSGENWQSRTITPGNTGYAFIDAEDTPPHPDDEL